MERFDLTGPLPTPGSTTVLEASAGTGKTFALAGLVTRYLADGVATLDEMLLITFSRAASQELRERVRGQIRDTVEALDRPAASTDNDIVTALRAGTAEDLRDRRQRLRDALSGFDAATIATIHQFCQMVLKSLGVAGDTDSGVRLVEGLEDVLTEVVDDLYLARFGQQPEDPPFTREVALQLARQVVANPGTQLRPRDPDPDTEAAARLSFAAEVVDELETRKRRLGILGYDDLLSRLANALRPDGDALTTAAADRMAQRWAIVMVDEFQDTDQVQWQVIERAFAGRATLILIGDPKQAIYAFRGGDIVTYLEAARTADERLTLAENWRSDAALVDRLQVLLRGAALGHEDIVVHEVEARHRGHRLVGAPNNDPLRLRVVRRDDFGTRQNKTVAMDRLRQHITADLVADISELITSTATFDGEPVRAAHVAIIVETPRDARTSHDALSQAGIPAVYNGDTDVYASRAAEDWLVLLEAFDQPNRSGLVRAAAATMFFGETAETLAAGGDALTDRVANTLREWADHGRERGIAAVFEAAQLTGMSRRVLAVEGGERDMTDLAHLTQLLHETGHRERYSLPALRDWLRTQRTARVGASAPEGERNRRLDSDATAVQIMTVWASKGLQYPVVYLPFAFNRHLQSRDFVLFHDNDIRCLHIGGADSPDYRAVEGLGKMEAANDDIRLTYVALTRAQSQVVAWWAPSYDEPNGGLSRLLRGRGVGERGVPERCGPVPSDDEAQQIFAGWQAAGGPTVEASVLQAPAAIARPELPKDLRARHFHRSIDTTWRRTSYSALLRGAADAPAPGVSSEPDTAGKDDEGPELTESGERPAEQPAGMVSPMSELPAGAAFGSLVHAVLEHADPHAPDLAAELAEQVREHQVWWPVDAAPTELAAALVPMHDTPLGPLANGLTLRDIGFADRLRELDFEIPLAGGDLAAEVADIRLSEMGRLLGEQLDPGDPLAGYAERLRSTDLGGQVLRGDLSGSIDVVLRVPGAGGDHRYLVVDYKTNRLGAPERPVTSADYRLPQLVQAMLHADYPLQALLYSVVLHRFLRWRQPGYTPERHLGGVLYLFVRGMCGPDTPVHEGQPAGVFGWRPPPQLVVALSDLLAAGRPAA
jgi:exodeoxyribonuclease V beta subunit